MRNVRLFILYTFFIFPVLAGSAYSTINRIGSGLITGYVLALIGLSVYHVVKRGKIVVDKRISGSILLCFVMFITWCIFRVEDMNGIMWILSVSVIFILFLSQIAQSVEDRDIERFMIFGSWFTVLIVIVILGVLKISYFSNPNYMGVLLVLYSAFPIGAMIYGHRVLGIISISFVLIGILAASSRAGLTALASMMIVHVVLVARRKRMTIPVAIATAACVIISVYMIYVNIDNPVWHYTSIRYFDKPVETGRFWIWELILDKVLERPVLGWGTGSLVAEIVGRRVSSHNGMLQLSYQVGFVGASLFLILYLCIFRGLWLLDTKVSRIALYILCGSFVLEMFEVFIIQNNTPFSGSVWLILGLGLSVKSDCKQV